LAGELAIAVSAHDGGKDEAGSLIEGPAGLDEVRAWRFHF
jgi:hypothetical protein